MTLFILPFFFLVINFLFYFILSLYLMMLASIYFSIIQLFDFVNLIYSLAISKVDGLDYS
jgi:hypothetical protein